MDEKTVGTPDSVEQLMRPGTEDFLAQYVAFSMAFLPSHHSSRLGEDSDTGTKGSGAAATSCGSDVDSSSAESVQVRGRGAGVYPAELTARVVRKRMLLLARKMCTQWLQRIDSRECGAISLYNRRSIV